MADSSNTKKQKSGEKLHFVWVRTDCRANNTTALSVWSGQQNNFLRASQGTSWLELQESPGIALRANKESGGWGGAEGQSSRRLCSMGRKEPGQALTTVGCSQLPGLPQSNALLLAQSPASTWGPSPVLCHSRISQGQDSRDERLS